MHADLPEVKALVGQRVEFSIVPLKEHASIYPDVLTDIRSVRYSHRYLDSGEEGHIFMRPIPEKKLKPVNKNCLYKKIQVKYSTIGSFVDRILVGYGAECKVYYVGRHTLATSLEERQEFDGSYGFDDISEYIHAKRCEDVIYGDEDD